MSKKVSFKITVLPGDGIGPEVMDGALEVLKNVGKKSGIEFNIFSGLIGGAAIDKERNPLPDKTLRLCNESDGVLLAAVGGPKWDKLEPSKKPETGLLRLRKELDV